MRKETDVTPEAAAGKVTETTTAGDARFPCGGCGAALAWDAAFGGIRCPFCGVERLLTTDPRATVEERELEEALRAAAAAPVAEREVRRAKCDSCGAVVEIPPTEKSGHCAYCGSSRVIEEEACASRVAPQAVLPFRVDRADAEARFRKWISSLWFRPNALRHRNSLTEMNGVLVPWWTFDSAASSRWTALAGHHYYVPVRVGKNTVMQRRTRWVPAAGSRSDFHDDVLICASRGLDAKLLNLIQPFPLRDLRPYQAEYLAGWRAETASVDGKEAWGLATKRILDEQRSRCAGDVPGDTHMSLSVDTTLTGRTYKHVLLPVWVAAYQFRGRTWRFLVNGATGEIHGEAPLSWVKITLLVLGILAAIGTVALIIASNQ